MNLQVPEESPMENTATVTVMDSQDVLESAFKDSMCLKQAKIKSIIIKKNKTWKLKFELKATEMVMLIPRNEIFSNLKI